MFCGNCGSELLSKSNFCSKCGKQLQSEVTRSQSSNLWYLLPLFLNIIGGLIMFVKLREIDPQKAKYGLLLGIAFSVLGLAFSLPQWILK